MATDTLQPHEVLPILRAHSRTLRKQSEVAEALTRETGEPWTQAMVSSLENGKKHFKVDTMLALAHVFDVDPEVFWNPATLFATPGYLTGMDQLFDPEPKFAAA